jgi:hypothetical protein
MSQQAVNAFGSAFAEYLLLIVPVGTYVGLEAYHKHEIHYFLISPEWAIANIFLQFQAVFMFVMSRSFSSSKLSKPKITILCVIGLVGILFSAFNALDSMHENTEGLIIFRAWQFVIASLLFILLTASSRYARYMEGAEIGQKD